MRRRRENGPATRLGLLSRTARLLAPHAPRTLRGVAMTAGYYGLYLVPVGAVFEFDLLSAYWLLSSVALPATLLRLHSRGGTGRTAARIVNAAVLLGNLALAVSLQFQGQGFNAQFYHHVALETLLLEIDAFRWLAIACAAYWVLGSLWLFALTRPDERAAAPTAPIWPAVSAVAVAVSLNVPAVSLAGNVVSNALAASEIILVPKQRRLVDPSVSLDGRNLVLVVAESLEATYGRKDIFGRDLTPRLTELAADALQFTDVRQVSHTGFTVGALVAASCGLPVAPNPFVGGSVYAADPNMESAICLGDVLAARGYRTVFLVGHDLRFAATGEFLEAHGFRELLGLRSLQGMLADQDYRHGWGLHDDTLFAIAKSKLGELESSEGPFALVVLTMDTHFPPGHPSASCGPPPEPGDRAFVIDCADRLVAGFVRDVRRLAPDAVVVLYSDHLAHESPQRAGLLPDGSGMVELAPGDYERHVLGLVETHRRKRARRLRFTIWDGDRQGTVIDRAGTHFDIMPTILDVLGHRDWSVHGFGLSLLDGSSPWLAHPRPDSLLVTYATPEVRVRAGATAVFDAAGPAMEIDGVRMLATNRGLALSDAAFALAVAPDGRARCVLGTRGVAAAEAAGKDYLVGLSRHPALNRRLLGAVDAETVYFAGRPGTPAFVVGALPLPSGRVAVNLPPVDCQVKPGPPPCNAGGGRAHNATKPAGCTQSR